MPKGRSTKGKAKTPTPKQGQLDVLNRESYLEDERRRAYLGSARVDLDALRFDNTPQDQPNLQNVQRLVAAFGNAGCLRLTSQHHVPAIINRHTLKDALASSALSRDHLFHPDLSTCSLLQFPDHCDVDCLHNRHRIAAAKKFLSPSEQWWVVDFYSSDKLEFGAAC